jgi:hypothetical protein
VDALYKYCAIIGCTLVGIQVVLQALGVFGDTDMDAHGADLDGGHVDIDGHGDFDHEAHPEGHGNIFFGVLSLKALTAFAGIFGLVGLVMAGRGVSGPTRLAAAVGAGAAGMFLVAWMMRGLSRLQASGTIDIRNALGRQGVVYLRIPGADAGRGKVTVEVQGRSMEFTAYTDGEAIETGARVTVEAVENGDTLKVIRS